MVEVGVVVLDGDAPRLSDSSWLPKCIRRGYAMKAAECDLTWGAVARNTAPSIDWKYRVGDLVGARKVDRAAFGRNKPHGHNEVRSERSQLAH